MMNRSDERKETHGASMARSPGAAKSAMSKEVHEGSDKVTHASSGGAEAGSKSVESEHVMGSHESVKAAGAEGFSDDASSKANRKEAGEPQREKAEKSAVTRKEVPFSGTAGGGKGGSEPAHKNVIGHGQRETVAKNCI